MRLVTNTRELSRSCFVVSLACVSSETHICNPFFFVFMTQKGQAFLAETEERGNKNRCVTEATHVLQRKLRKDQI